MIIRAKAVRNSDAAKSGVRQNTHSSIPEYNRELASNGIVTGVISGVINEVITEQRGINAAAETSLRMHYDIARTTRKMQEAIPLSVDVKIGRKLSSEGKRRYIYIYTYRQPDSQDGN